MLYMHVGCPQLILLCAKHRAYIASHNDVRGCAQKAPAATNQGRCPGKPRRRSMFITTLLAKLRAWLRYRETVRELSRLTNRELDDLGIRRGEIESIARTHAFS